MQTSPFSALNRRQALRLTTGVLALAATGSAASRVAAAAAPRLPTSPPPGFYVTRVGAITIAVLCDGELTLPGGRAFMPNADTAELARLSSRFHTPADRITVPVNTVLIQSGGDLVLVDAGSGKAFGPTAGRLHDLLGTVGVAPADVTKVVVSHPHPDHVGGLLAEGGGMAFPGRPLLVSEADLQHWFDDAARSAAPEAFRPFFDMARDHVAPYRSAGQVQTYRTGTTIAPGVTAHGLPGHTPGHSGFQIESEGQRLLLVSDLLHHHVFLTRHPDWHFFGDTDGALAAATRRRLLDAAASDGSRILGAHLPFPGIGHIDRHDGAYAYLPESYTWAA